MLTLEEKEEIDLLTNEVKIDHSKIEELFTKFGHSVLKEDPIALSETYKVIREICEKNESKNELLRGMRLLAESIFAYYESRFQEVIDKTEECIKIFKNYKRTVFAGMSYMINGGSYRSMGMIDKAVQGLYKSIELIDEYSKNNIYLTYSYYHLAEIFNFIKDFEAAKESYKKASKFAKLSGNDNGLFRSYDGLGCMYLQLQEFQLAKEYLDKCITVNEMSDSQKSRANCDLGTYYLEVDDFEKAEKFLQESYNIRVANQMEDASSTSLIQLGKLEIKKRNVTQAIQYLEDALKITIDKKSKSKQVDCYYNLALAYNENGQLSESIKAFMEYDKLQREFQSITLQNVYKIKNQKIKEQKILIEKTLKDVKSSITYAKRIQKAILPPSETISRYLPQSYVLYRPKDIVAGDFYWFDLVDDKILFAVADCTGHGVPGAMVSVVCHNALNRAVREYNLTQPSHILDKVNEIVQESLSKSEKNQVKDGMDIALCAYDPVNRMIEFSGANNPLYIISNDENSNLENYTDTRPVGHSKKELFVVKGSRQPIGKFEKNIPFENHTIQLRKNDEIVLFSDGFPDQFGGPENKKIMYRSFKQLLISLQSEPFSSRKGSLGQFFDEWKKDTEQTDDVCVIGIKIS